MKKLLYWAVPIIITAFIFSNCKNIQSRFNPNNEPSKAESYIKGEFIVIMPQCADSVALKQYLIDNKLVVKNVSKYDNQLQLWYRPDGTDGIPKPKPAPKPIIPPIQNRNVIDRNNNRITLFKEYEQSFMR